MITDPRPAGWVTLVRAGCIALAIWFGALLVLPLASEASRDITLVAITEADALQAIALADVDILSGSGRIYSLRGRRPGFIRQLYSAGGIIVFGGGGSGCRYFP